MFGRFGSAPDVGPSTLPALIVISAQMSHFDHLLAPGIMVTAVGFAVLSVPIAARELQARTQGQPGQPRSEVR